MTRFIYFILLIGLGSRLFAQEIASIGTINGSVTSIDGTPLPGATVTIKGTTTSVSTNQKGFFSINIPRTSTILKISFIGYKNEEISVNGQADKSLSIMLSISTEQLKELIVSTGYQTLPKERATGSFVQIDNTLLNRRVSTDIISRLEDVTSGLIFNKGTKINSGPQQSISIRGNSTINANTQPLIVVDSFPFDGDIADINPNDVESITVLKDAAAASIWGARAGNGVIVITTKGGGYNRPARISFNSNVTVGNQPDLFYQYQMSSADFIDVEKMLFANGFYNKSELSSTHMALTPVVELLIAARDGKITGESASQQIEAFNNVDVRNDAEKYLYRKNVNQQYALNISGGAENQKYFVSTGYDDNMDNSVGNVYNRLTLNANNTYSLFKNKLEITTGLYYTRSNRQTNNQGYDGTYRSSVAPVPFYPYAQLVDSQGNPLSIVKDYRTSFVQSAEKQGLLDWTYNPIRELNSANNISTITDYRLNANLRYKILPGLNVMALYLYESYMSDASNLQNQQTYYTRNLINQFTAVAANGPLMRPIPLGGILDKSTQVLSSQNFRAQLDYNKNWNQNELTAIAGYEIKDAHTLGDTHRLYGYDDEHAVSAKVDYISLFKRYDYPGATGQIPNRETELDLTDRYLSYYANAAYTYRKRYILSGSGRIDQSNIFGVNTNQKGVPLWSAGIGWNLSQENFYKLTFLPYLKLRATYGYNGNVYKNISAYTTANYFGNDPSTQLPYATINNPPDPELRWERVRVINLGIDFETINSTISGSLEYYHKRGIDLIGSTAFAPSTGITTFTGNNASITGQGIDVILNTRNFDRQFKWDTNLLFSHVTDKVTDYNVAPTSLPGIATPVIGHPLYSQYSYQWAGLNRQTGDPMGYLNGVTSKEYTKIIASAVTGNYIYNGPARPTYFGSLRNTFSYKNISLSANISYRFGYYFRKTSIAYATVLKGQGGSGEYSARWQKAGDEQFTQVPSIPAVSSTSRDNFYTSSSVLIAKADNIRFQDINLGYNLTKAQWWRLPFTNVQLYLYINNLGILWKANKGYADPDYSTATSPPLRTVAVGLKVDL